MKYAGEPTELIIGDRNTIREFCTFNLGSPGGGRDARRGRQLDHGLRAPRARLRVGNHTIFANNAHVAGHVDVGDWVIGRPHGGAPVHAHRRPCDDGFQVLTAVRRTSSAFHDGARATRCRARS
jgi:acyl-[acyl carrier protein]--UDP-N-acetylglucosamine O-acyltransferase